MGSFFEVPAEGVFTLKNVETTSVTLRSPGFFFTFTSLFLRYDLLWFKQGAHALKKPLISPLSDALYTVVLV